MRQLLLILCLSGLCLGPALTSRADIVSSFDTDADGWTCADLRSYPGPYDPPIGYYTLTWIATGGRPGGYVSRHDPSNYSFSFQAPAKFLGDVSAYYGGRLRFSLMTTTADWGSDNVVVWVGNNGKIIVSQIGSLPGTTWTDYQIILLESNFRYNHKNGAVVSKADLLGVLGDLKALRILGEFGSQVVETTSLDTVKLLYYRPLGTNNRAVRDAVTQASAGDHPFRIWGKAHLVDSSTLELDDGYGQPITVVAPGYSGVSEGNVVRATGALDFNSGDAKLICAAADVAEVN
jgi:hypothetical protein